MIYMSKNLRLIIMISVLILLVAVGITQYNSSIKSEVEPDNQVTTEDLQIEDFYETIDFTEDELEFINKLQDKGYITIATRDSNTVYKQMSDGNIEGFHYNLVKMFSEHINVDLKVKVISFNDYFRHNGEIPEGVKTDSTIVYKPDLFDEVDIYCDNMTILPWRQRLMTFVELIPVKVLAITRKGEEIKTVYRLRWQNNSSRKKHNL